MAGHDAHLREVLDGYAKCIQDKNLALDKHQRYLVRWVGEFLRFDRARAGYRFEQALGLFRAAAGGRVGTKPGQLQQASDVIGIDRYGFRGARTGDGDPRTTQAFVDDAAMVERLGGVRRCRHDARRAERAYPQGNAPLARRTMDRNHRSRL